MKPPKYFASIPQFIIWLFSGLWSLCVSGVTEEGNAFLKHPVLANCFQWKIVAGNGDASFKSVLGPRGPDHPPFITHLFGFLFILPSFVLFFLTYLCFPFLSFHRAQFSSPLVNCLKIPHPNSSSSLLFWLAASRSWQQSNLEETIAFRYALLDSLMQEGNFDSHCGNSVDLSNSQWRDF